VVGAYSENVGTNVLGGAIYTFDVTSHGLPTAPTARIVASGETISGELGSAIAADATTIVAGLSRSNGNAGAAYVYADPGPTMTKPTFTDGDREVMTRVSEAATITVHLLRRNKHGHYVADGTVRKPALKNRRAVVALHRGGSLATGHWELKISASNALGTTPARTLHLTVR
jgi:hypothetical protein